MMPMMISTEVKTDAAVIKRAGLTLTFTVVTIGNRRGGVTEIMTGSPVVTGIGREDALMNTTEVVAEVAESPTLDESNARELD
jgi:hypothetical protein